MMMMMMIIIRYEPKRFSGSFM
jgi:hypothetical protein